MKNTGYFFIVIIAFLHSCKTHKDFVITKTAVDEAINLFDSLKYKEFTYDNLSLRFNAKADIDKSFNSFSGHIRIKRDSLIWVSISALFGIELFRILISQDEVKMLNRTNNTYFIGNYSIINRMFNAPLDFDMLQAFITGNDFSFYENDVFVATIDSNLHKLSTTNRKKITVYTTNKTELKKVLIQDIWLNPVSYKIVRQKIKSQNQVDNVVGIEYSNFTEEKNKKKFPGKIDFNIKSGDNIYIINLEYSKVEIDKPFNFSFNIPDKYTPVQ